MVKKCERCGIPALNDDSEFCNRCGSVVIEEPKIKVPVCGRCKTPAPNAEVLFCNRCGTEYPAAEPEPEYPVCPRCGNIIHDEMSEFCNRCGASVRPEPKPELPTCSRCGNTAPDREALFCNRCGAAYKKEPENSHPHCPRCGHIAPDDQAQFCNRCGATISAVPGIKKPVCQKCGAIPLDEETLFCNRCGTPFNNPLPDAKMVQSPLSKPVQPVSVKISKKKQPPVTEPAEDLWDPVPEEVIAPGYFSYPSGQPAASQKKKYAHLPLVADEPAGSKVRDESIVISGGNSKKYSHLPLVADEFKEKPSPRLEIQTPYYPDPPKEKKVGRKGLFDLMKK